MGLSDSMRSRWVRVSVALGLAGAPVRADDEYEREPYNYWKVPLTDPVSRLKAKLDSGELKLDGRSERTWLQGVLTALEVPASSQVLVFSKTSLQRSLINPESPRALYFNDEVYVGWVPGGAVELSAIDPQVGPVFYLLRRPPAGSTPPGADQRPVFVRDQECLNCHAGPMTGNVPGYMIRSVYPDAAGEPILSAGTKLTGQHSPLEQRWGGWYVTGSHDPMRHMGNAIATAMPTGAVLDQEPGANLASLHDHFDVSRYLLDQSDIVALMVLEHQATLHTLFAQANFSVKSALFRQEALRRELGIGGEEGLSESTRRIIEHEAARLVKSMLFSDEVKLAPEGVTSHSAFLEDFSRAAPKDHEGQSLKTLRLGSRLFRNRCSYLIYTKAFDGLPDPLRGQVGHLLHEALAGSDPLRLGAHLPPEEKARIVQILRETKPTLAAGW